MEPWQRDIVSSLAHSNDPQALLLQQRAGRLGDAEAAYLRLLARWPDLPDTWYNLVLLQRRAGRHEAALASYQQALDHGVSQPEEVHLNRAVIYSDCLRQDAAAERELNAALTLNPNYVPALLNLANLREDFGRCIDLSHPTLAYLRVQEQSRGQKSCSTTIVLTALITKAVNIEIDIDQRGCRLTKSAILHSKGFLMPLISR